MYDYSDIGTKKINEMFEYLAEHASTDKSIPEGLVGVVGRELFFAEQFMKESWRRWIRTLGRPNFLQEWLIKRPHPGHLICLRYDAEKDKFHCTLENEANHHIIDETTGNSLDEAIDNMIRSWVEDEAELTDEQEDEMAFAGYSQ